MAREPLLLDGYVDFVSSKQAGGAIIMGCTDTKNPWRIVHKLRGCAKSGF